MFFGTSMMSYSSLNCCRISGFSRTSGMGIPISHGQRTTTLTSLLNSFRRSTGIFIATSFIADLSIPTTSTCITNQYLRFTIYKICRRQDQHKNTSTHLPSPKLKTAVSFSFTLLSPRFCKSFQRQPYYTIQQNAVT